jgi:hypothetical protein
MRQAALERLQGAEKKEKLESVETTKNDEVTAKMKEEDAGSAQQSTSEPVKDPVSSLGAALSRLEAKEKTLTAPLEETRAAPESTTGFVAPPDDTKVGKRRSVYSKEEMMR